VNDPRCTETGPQVVTVATKPKPFDLYRPAKGLGGVAEDTPRLQKCFRNVVDLSQNTEFLFRFCFVSFGWTQPYEAFASGVASVDGYGQTCTLTDGAIVCS
jgi:hypothetical protein